MPAFPVTAVNTGTETLTATGVAASGTGFVTGSRFRLRNVGGALPAATPSLAGVTDYFAIRIDDDNIKVAISSSNAFAGTAVNITGAGSGTNTIEYGLPYCIPTALAAPGAQIKSADANGTWNALVALYALLTGQAQSVWSAITVAVASTFSALVTAAAGIVVGANQHVTLSGTGQYKHGDRSPCYLATQIGAINSGTASVTGDGRFSYTAATVIVYGIPILPGQRVKSVTFAVEGNNTVDGNYVVQRAPANSAAANIGTGTLTNVSTTRADVVVDVTDTTFADGEALLLIVESTASGLTVGNIRPTFDHP